MYKKENLVVLMYASNTCYTNVVLPDNPSVKEAKTIIDADAGTFTAPDPHAYGSVGTYQIGGNPRRCPLGSRWGTIGVYDRTNLGHLNNMVHAANSATEDQGCIED